MKKTLFTLLVLFTVNTAFSQKEITFDICGTTSVKKVTEKNTHEILTISLEKLLECSEIKTSTNGLNVQSFAIGMTSASEKEYIEVKIDGNKINDKAKELLKKHNPKKIYIEQIKLVNTKGISTNGGHFTVIL